MSAGVVVTLLLLGAVRAVVTASIVNAASVTAILAALMTIYKTTCNSWGPMLAWTAINDPVWYLAQLAVS